MCWNADVSLATFLIGVLVCYSLFKRNKKFDKTIGLFILFYSSIQFGEFLIWKSLEGEKYGFSTPQELNSFATKLIYINLYSHSAIVGAGIYYETQNSLYLKLGMIPLIYGLIKMPSFKSVTEDGKEKFISKPTENSKRQLVWDFNKNFYILICLMTLYILYSFKELRHIAIFFVVTCIISYSLNREGGDSYWCWISAFTSMYALYYR
jgi:hypothetical protein